MKQTCLLPPSAADHGCHCHCHAHSHESEHGGAESRRRLGLFLVSTLMLLAGFFLPFAHEAVRAAYYVAAFLPVGLPVLRNAWREMREGDVFNEFFLMGVATVGAFVVGEYPEAVGVMLFYGVGEWFQDRAVGRANRDIEALVNLRPAHVRAYINKEWTEVSPDAVAPGTLVEVPAGGRVPIDGVLQAAGAEFDTSALTGESLPRRYEAGAEVPAGVIATGGVVRLRTSRPAADSALARIMQLVAEARDRKSPTELFIRSFARIYTPVVLVLAVLLAVLPPLLGGGVWSTWLYRACVFLVISCPCALVVSIPLGYYAGIGLASRRGILFKGGSYLDALTRVRTVLFDKTGTLTQGRFSVVRVEVFGTFGRDQVLRWAAALENHSTHPLGTPLRLSDAPEATDVAEVAGQGLTGTAEGHRLRVGNYALVQDVDDGAFRRFLDASPWAGLGTLVFVTVDDVPAGMVVLADALKADAAEAVELLRRLGIRRIGVLSGDRSDIVQRAGRELSLDMARGDLLPADKVRLAADASFGATLFVGDGINDAPVLAAASVGMAMGAGGSDAAVETADVVVQTDSLRSVPEALRIARLTRRVVLLNIVLALGVKFLVLLFGALGLAGMWLAVFADTGVALWCVANVLLFSRLYLRRAD